MSSEAEFRQEIDTLQGFLRSGKATQKKVELRLLYLRLPSLPQQLSVYWCEFRKA